MRAFKIGMVIALTSASAFSMNKAELIEAMASSMGIDKKDIRRGMEAVATETDKALKKKCSSVYIEGLALLKKGGGDCDDAGRPVRPGQKSVDPIDEDSDDDGLPDVELVMGNPLYEDDGDISNNPLYQGMAARFADNMFGDFIPRAAEAQDYNAARSNKPTSRAAEGGDYNSSRSNKYSVRGNVIGAGARVMSAYSKDLVRIFTSEDSGERFLEAISEEMSSLELDPKFARAIYSDFISSLQQVYKKEQELLKSADVNQSEDIYEKAASNSGLTIEALKEIVKTASLITQKRISIGDTVDMVGFGSFSISKRSARTGRNPQTGKEIKIAAAPRVVKIRKRPGRTKYANITLKK